MHSILVYPEKRNSYANPHAGILDRLSQIEEPGSTPQQFTIAGAATGNGTYVGDSSTPPIHVTGAAWSIDFQHKATAAFVESFYEINFPSHNGSQYTFDININDDDADPVFDDLILTCSTPVTQSDFVLFGNVSWYSGCIFTPCNPLFSVIIDSEAALQAALQRTAIRTVIEKLYPERVFPKPVGPGPDPGPFRPFLLPVEGNSIVPQKQVKVFGSASEATANVAVESASATLTSQLATVNSPITGSSASLSAVDAAALINPIFDVKAEA